MISHITTFSPTSKPAIIIDLYVVKEKSVTCDISGKVPVLVPGWPPCDMLEELGPGVVGVVGGTGGTPNPGVGGAFWAGPVGGTCPTGACPGCGWNMGFHMLKP